MGGSSATGSKDEPMPGTGKTMTQQPFIGDSQNMLAQQLAAGGYGNAPDLMTMLSQTYSPMQVLDTRPGAAPTTPTTGGSGGTGGSSGGATGLGDWFQDFLRKLSGQG